MQSNSMLDVLNRTEQRLSAIIASAMDPIITIDEHHEITLVNAAVEQMFGYSEADLLGKPISMLIPERYHAAHEQHIENFARTNLSNRAMGRFRQIVGRRADGGEFPIDASISQMEWAGQRLFTVILRDVTRRIEAEKALRDSEERLRLAVDRGGVGLWEWDIASDQLTWNARVKAIFGLPEDAEGLMVEQALGAIHPDDRAEVERAYATALENRTDFDHVFRILRPNGEVRWIVSKGHGVYDPGGQPVRVIGSALDITERKQAEQTLRKNYELLDRIFATTHFCVVYLDRDLNFVRVNKAYADACGHPPEFFPGRNHFDLYPSEEFESVFRRVVATGEPFTIYANPFQFPDHPEWGVTYWDWTLHPLRNEDGRVEGLLFALLDVTERRRSERELERKTALAQLQESLARAANEATTPEEAIKICLARLCEFSNWSLARILITHQLRGDLSLPGQSVWEAANLARYDEFIQTSENIGARGEHGQFVGVVLREKRPVWITDINEEHEFSRRAAALGHGLRAWFAFPVVVQGKVVAVLEFFADSPRPIDLALIEASETIAAQLARVIERGRTEKINAQLAAIVENSNDAIISRGPDRAILTWNAAAERLFGYSAAEVIGRNVSLLIPVDQEARAAQGRALLEDGLPVSAYDAVRLGKDGRRIDISVTASPIKDASGKMIGASLVFRDIGERKRADIEHAQLAAIVESSNDAILIRGPERTILSWNAAAERLFGWSAQEAVGQSIDLIVPRERIGQLQPFIERAARGEPVSPIETTHLRKDGARIATQVTFSPVRNKQGNVIAHSYTARDMTELKRNEEALRSYATRVRELSRRLREVEETERHAISRELHDRIGQELSTLTLWFGKLAARLTKESPSAVQKQLQDMQGLLKSTVENVRDVMAELRPPVLDDYGLHAALRQLVTEFAKHSGISVELIGVDLQPRLPSIVETAMFRISQEALNNIAKHAQAKKVEISLGEASERVVLDIADDGVGFDAGETRQDGQHWGMITMRERAEAVGITLCLESAPGAGTRVVLEVERAAP